MELNKSLIGKWCQQYYECNDCDSCFMKGLCLQADCVSRKVMNDSKEDVCFISKPVCGELMTLLDKCDDKYGYISDI